MSVATRPVRGAGKGGTDPALEEIKKRFKKLPKQQRKDVVHLLDQLVSATGDDAREIEQALAEILAPADYEVIETLDTEVDSETVTRLRAYRERVGRSIRSRRQELEMTQAALAEKAGIPQSHVSRLECGKLTATYITIKKVAKALKIAANQLDPGF
jgi:ribosome-binding protein aMBF1 (putative translation factor)